MATDIQFSVTNRNAQLDAIETEAGTTAVGGIWTGTRPANCAAANTGTRVATITLPADYMNAASAGAKTLLGTWQDALADAAGVAGYWRLYKSDGTTCFAQGDCSLPGAGGSMELINTNIAVNQPITITSFTLTAAGA